VYDENHIKERFFDFLHKLLLEYSKSNRMKWAGYIARIGRDYNVDRGIADY
jgi:hypothetical protein